MFSDVQPQFTPDEFDPVALDEQGFLIDVDLWDEGLATHLARLEGIPEMNDVHWAVVRAVRERFLAFGAAPLMRQVCRRLDLPMSLVQHNFTGCVQIWRIAGLPDPGAEVLAHGP